MSLEYEVFEPTESFHYSTLKSNEEKEKYVAVVQENNARIERKSLINRTMMLVTYITATGLLLFGKKIIKFNN